MTRTPASSPSRCIGPSSRTTRVYNYLLQPKTFGEGGFWTEFDWDQALRMGSEAVGLPFSGEYGFAETEMYWPLTHTVAPAGQGTAVRRLPFTGGAARLAGARLSR